MKSSNNSLASLNGDAGNENGLERLAAAAIRRALKDAGKTPEKRAGLAREWLLGTGARWALVLGVDRVGFEKKVGSIPFPAAGKNAGENTVFEAPTCVIINDPDREGGFSPGAEFSHESTREMLARGVFTPGTLLMLGEGQYVVQGMVGRRQELQSNSRIEI